MSRPSFRPAILPSLTEGVSKLEQARPCRTICTSSRSCTGDFPVSRGLQEIKLLHGVARSRFDTGSTHSRPYEARKSRFAAARGPDNGWTSFRRVMIPGARAEGAGHRSGSVKTMSQPVKHLSRFSVELGFATGSGPEGTSAPTLRDGL